MSEEADREWAGALKAKAPEIGRRGHLVDLLAWRLTPHWLPRAES